VWQLKIPGLLLIAVVPAGPSVRVTRSCSSAGEAFEELGVASSAIRLVSASSSAVSISSSALGDRRAVGRATSSSKRTVNVWPPGRQGLVL